MKKTLVILLFALTALHSNIYADTQWTVTDPVEGTAPDFTGITIRVGAANIYVYLSYAPAPGGHFYLYLNNTHRHSIRLGGDGFQLVKHVFGTQTILYTGNTILESPTTQKFVIPKAHIPDIINKRVWAYSMTSTDRIPDSGELLLDPATGTTVTVNATPQPQNDAVSTYVNFPTTLSVLTNDSDPDGDPIWLTSVTNPLNGIVQINSNDTITYTPNRGYLGTDSFTYTITDGELSNTAQVDIALEVQSQTDYLMDGALWTITDPAEGVFPDFKRLTISTNPSGELKILVDYHSPVNAQNYSYTDLTFYVPNSTHSYSFKFRRGYYELWFTAGTSHKIKTGPLIQESPTSISLRSSLVTTDPIGKSVRGFSIESQDYIGDLYLNQENLVYAPNQAPQPNNDSYTVIDDSTTIFDVLINDLEPDNDPLLLRSVSHPLHGNAHVTSDGKVSYRPYGDYNSGPDSFTYTVTDYSVYVTATVNVNVVFVNDPPDPPYKLRCNGTINPENITDYSPTFSWRFYDQDGGASQSAYQLVISTDLALSNIIYDSGKLAGSDESLTLTGTELSAYPNMPLYWAVRTWDEYDVPGEYSEANTFNIFDIGLRAYDGTQVIKLAAEPLVDWLHELRIHKNGVNYGIILVDVSDPDASKIRIQTSTGVYAIKKM